MTLFKRGKSSHGLERVKQPNEDSIFDILSEGTFSLEFLSICGVFDFTQNEQKFTLYHVFIDFRLGCTLYTSRRSHTQTERRTIRGS